MSLNVKTGVITAKTTTGTQAYTGIGFQPKAIIFFAVTMTATGFNNADGDVQQCYGFAAASGTATGIGYARHTNWNVGGGSSEKWQADSVLQMPGTTGGLVCVANMSSFDSDGFTLNWTTVDGTAERIGYIALGGSDITNAYVGRYQTSGGSTDVVTAPGFKPDIVFFGMTTSSTWPLVAATHGNMGLGVACASGQGSVSVRSNNNAAPNTDENCYLATDACTTAINTTADTLQNKHNLASLDTNGFTLNTPTVAANTWVSYLAIKGGSYAVVSDTQKTSTGTKTKTGVGFKPKALFTLSANKESSGSIGIDSKLSIGATDGVSEASTWAGSNDNVTPSAANSGNKANATLLASTTNTVNAEAVLSSFDADGYTLNWTTADATAREFIAVAFGSTPSPLFIENILEGGTDETAITTGNSGGISGTAFDAIENNSGANPVVFDSARALYGSYSCRTTVNGSGTANVQWRGTAIPSEIGTIYTRHYAYFTRAPVANSLRHIAIADATTLTRHASYEFLTAGRMRLSDANFASADMTNAVPLNQWVRIETRTKISATVGEMTIRLYNAAGAFIEEKAHTSNGSLDTVSGSETGADLVGWGQLTANTASETFWMDSFAVSDIGWIGPKIVPTSSTLLAAILADDPHGCWMLDTPSDKSGNGNTLTEFSAPPIVASIIPTVTTGARDLDGVADEFSAADHASLDLGDVFTLEAWVQIDAYPGAGVADTIVEKGAQAYQMFINDSGKLGLSRSSVAQIVVSSASMLNDGTTVYHCVCTKTGATVKQYINGVDVTGTVTNSTCVDTTSPLKIGNNGGSEFWNGRIQAVAVYPRVLSAERVLRHYQAGTIGLLANTMLDDSPRGMWMLEGPAGGGPTTTPDYSVNGLNLTEVTPTQIKIVPSIIPSVSSNASDVTGKFGDGWKRADDNLLDLGDVFTLEAWIKLDSLPASGVDSIFYKEQAYQLLVRSTGTLELARPSSGVILAVSTETITPGFLYHVVGTKNGSTIKVYMNGKDVTGAVTNSTCIDTTNALYIGCAWEQGEVMDGKIQAAAVYPTALSVERIRSHYYAGIS